MSTPIPPARAPVSNEATLSIGPGPLAATVLGRVVAILAARAHCPVDRLDDALLVTDALAAHVPSHSTDGRVHVQVRSEPGSITLEVAPLRAGGADGLIADSAIPGIGSLLERVADELARTPADGSGTESLAIRLNFESGSSA